MLIIKKLNFFFEDASVSRFWCLTRHMRGACTQNAFSLIYIRRRVFLLHHARFPSYRGAPFIISPAALYSAVTPLRGWEIAFPLVDECSRWYTIEVAHIRGGKKQTDNGPRDFDSNRINRCRGTILPQRRVTCSTRQAIEIPLSLLPWLITMGIHRYAIDTHGVLYIHASSVRERFPLCAPLHLICAHYRKTERVTFSAHVPLKKIAANDRSTKDSRMLWI